MIEILAPAKINLFLRICGKNTASFHLLDSLVAFTEFGDRMTIEPANEDKLILTGDFGNQLKVEEEKNLVLLALDAFRSAGGTFCHLRITLDKRIPISAGLGGGSTDAAALLQTLNEHSDNPLSENQMYQIALKLGADVPVCLKGGCQRVANIGQTMKPHNLPKMAASRSSGGTAGLLDAERKKCSFDVGTLMSMLGGTAFLFRTFSRCCLLCAVDCNA